MCWHITHVGESVRTVRGVEHRWCVDFHRLDEAAALIGISPEQLAALVEAEIALPDACASPGTSYGRVVRPSRTAELFSSSAIRETVDKMRAMGWRGATREEAAE